MKERLYIIYEHADGRRARMTSGAGGSVLLIIRENYGQGACILARKYTSRAGARAALSRRGGHDWRIIKQRKEWRI